MNPALARTLYGAAIGGGVGGLWGAVSDDTSVIGGMLGGAAMGALGGRYGGAGFLKAKGGWNTAAGQFSSSAYGTAAGTLGGRFGRGAWGQMKADWRAGSRAVRDMWGDGAPAAKVNAGKAAGARANAAKAPDGASLASNRSSGGVVNGGRVKSRRSRSGGVSGGFPGQAGIERRAAKAEQMAKARAAQAEAEAARQAGMYSGSSAAGTRANGGGMMGILGARGGGTLRSSAPNPIGRTYGNVGPRGISPTGRATMRRLRGAPGVAGGSGMYPAFRGGRNNDSLTVLAARSQGRGLGTSVTGVPASNRDVMMQQARRIRG